MKDKFNARAIARNQAIAVKVLAQRNEKPKGDIGIIITTEKTKCDDARIRAAEQKRDARAMKRKAKGETK